MKAIIVREYGEPEVMKIEEAPTPEPSGKQVLVKIEAAGVNPVRSSSRSVKAVWFRVPSPARVTTMGDESVSLIKSITFS